MATPTPLTGAFSFGSSTASSSWARTAPDGREVEGNLSPRMLSVVFALLMATNIMVNFDSGGTAAVLVLLDWGCHKDAMGHDEPEVVNWVGKQCQINTTAEDTEAAMEENTLDPTVYPCLGDNEKGILGAMPYAGLSFGCPVVGVLLNKFGQKAVVLTFLVGNVVATFLFAFVLDTYWLYFSKFIVGFTQSALCIYSPVWVNERATSGSKTLWLGLMQGAGAIGAMVGYSVAGCIKTAHHRHWQVAFKIQAFVLAALCTLLGFVPRSAIEVGDAVEDVQENPRRRTSITRVTTIQRSFFDTNRQSKALLEKQGSQVREPPSFTTTIKQLVANRIFMPSLLTLCALFFVLTGVQFWSSMYLAVSFGRPDQEVTTSIIAVAGTGPILGVLIGSAVFDRYTGVEADEQKALLLGTRITSVWGLIASLAGIAAAAVPPVTCGEPGAELAFHLVIGFIWVQLLFGGAMLPAVTGISLSSVPADMRTTASSLSMLLYNVFGFMLGSYLPGQISDICEHYGLEKPVRLRIAMASVVGAAIFGLFGMSIANLEARGRQVTEQRLSELDARCDGTEMVRTSRHSGSRSPPSDGDDSSAAVSVVSGPL